MGVRRGRRYDELRVSVAKIDGIGRRLEVTAARHGISDELTAVRREFDRAQARRWALITRAIASGVPPARIAERAGVEEAWVQDVAEAIRRARLGF